MNLVDMQKIIDFCRENYENWKEMKIVFHVNSNFTIFNEKEVFEEDVNNSVVDEQENILILSSGDLE